jgi:parallel beta-helix repeat protein
MNSRPRSGNHDWRGWVVLMLAVPCLSVVRPSPARATTYYVDGSSAAARDSNPGTSAQPWKTIGKATGLLQPGDTVLVKAGVYREFVTLSKSGTAAKPITIAAAPGAEGKAVINAAEPVTNWRKCTGPQDCAGNPNWSHIYYADVAGFVSAHPDKTFAVRQVFQQGQLLPRSRYPDAGWSYPTSIADPGRVFSDSSLAQPDNYFAGAVCHIKTAVWLLDAVPITEFSRGTITLASSPRSDLSTRFGYFITNIVGEINAEGEWAYDPAQKRIFLWPRGDAAEDIEFTYRECCLRTNEGVSFNIVRGLTMRNAWTYGILVCRSHDTTIENNTVEYCFDRSIRLQTEGGSCDNNQILRNTVKYSGSCGINVDGGAAHYNIEGNYVYATGVEHFGDDMLTGIGEGVFIWGPYGRVWNNRVDRTARGALYIAGQPSYREICFNHVTNTGLALSDGGACLYTAGYHTGPETDYIHHNIFAEAIGCNTMNRNYEAGLPVTIEKYGGDSPGLYVDEEGNHRIIEHNTIIHCRSHGIYFHWAPENVVRHNTLYGNGEYQVKFNGNNSDRQKLIDDVLQDNILFSTTARQYTLWVGMNYDGIRFGQSDRNYFYNPYNSQHIYVYWLNPSTGAWITQDLSLSAWRTQSGYDGNSREFSYLSQLPQVALAYPVQSRIVYNASLDVNTVDLGPDLYCDVQGNGIRGKLTLQPFESKILIAALAAPVSDCATNPVPAEGGQAGAEPILEWTAAAMAAAHHVYLGTAKEAVSAADTASPLFRGRQTGTSFSLAGLTQPGGRYFWRIDEVEADGTTIHKGVVWTFIAPDLLVIDGFESYTDGQRNRIEETWRDGSFNHSGAQVGRRSNPPGDGHGTGSMLLAYDNAKAPFVSEVEREFAAEQDWTAGAMDTLSLWHRGDLVSFGETTPGSFVMSAAGADIWYARDELRYAYKRLDGDGSMAVRIEALAGVDYWTKGGVMIRESLGPASAHASMFVIPSGVSAFQNRPANNSSNCFSAQDGSELGFPCWVKIVREGNQFTGYQSTDGITWIRVRGTEAGAPPNPQTINMPHLVYLGLALSSHAADVVTTATFSGVQTTGAVTGLWQVADIGVDHPGNSPDDLYVVVDDGDGKTAMVVNPNPAAVNAKAWTEWKIPLNSLAGVDLSRVRRMTIGVGGRESMISPGAGRISIDDIRLSASEPSGATGQ